MLVKDALLIGSIFFVSLAIWTAPVQGALKKCKCPGAIVFFFICSVVACIGVANSQKDEVSNNPSLLLLQEQNRLTLYNRGSEDLYLFGYKFGNEPVSMYGQGVLVPKKWKH